MARRWLEKLEDPAHWLDHRLREVQPFGSAPALRSNVHRNI
jgi:hypothetical protein